MKDRDSDDIRDDMCIIADFMSAEFEEEFELLNQITNEEPPDDIENPRAWYLGQSIITLSKADIVVFDSEWNNTPGCILEHMVCALYNIPYVDMGMNYEDDQDDINDYTTDINEAGRLNEILSEAYEEVSGEAEDFEDALGFEHDDDMIECGIDELEPGEYDADAYFNHSGVKGQKWGQRRYQNPDGSLTPLGREHYGYKGPEDTVFISGSSKTQFEDSGYYRKNLSDKVRQQIDNEISKHSHIIVGDAPGIDRQVQDYLKKSNYDNVEIFGPGNKDVRYKADKKWKSTTVDNPDAEPNSKEWLASKDRVMDGIADRGIAVVLDEGAKATRNNVSRLMAANKDVYVYELSKHGSSYDRHIH